VPGALRIDAVEGDVVSCTSSFTVVRTINGGNMDVFVCGRTQDKIRIGAQGPKLVERTDILDSRQMDILLDIPL
jgi:3-phenylpropionate/cinnamic acid dioxygenase small subunit